MILLLLLALAGAGEGGSSSDGNDEAAARLAEIRADFPSRAKSQSLQALERLARSAATTEAGGEAAAWRGALAQQSGDLDGATLWYQQALSAPADGLARRLGLRGLGDVDLLSRRYSSAQLFFARASVGAEGVLAEELVQKQALAIKLTWRQRVEWASWIFFAAALVYFAARAWRGQGPLRPPLEAIYVLPVYLLLVVGGLGRDANVLHALIAGGAASMGLIVTTGLAARRSPPTQGLRLLQAAMVVVANLALFFAVLNRMSLVDTLITTAQM